jgi:site-specific recombinase XerD
MAKEVKRVRGVYEREPGSGVWWIRFTDRGKIRREKVGRRSDAIALYQKRKAESRAGVKLPENLRHKGIRVKDICDQAVAWYTAHGRKDFRTFKSRTNVIIAALGDRVADEMTPQDIDGWLGTHTEWSAGTKNRYKTVLSKAFQLALVAGKVKGNPARLVAHRAENNRRIRYLLPDEERRLRDAIAQRCPDQFAALDVALHTGMRKAEQFSLGWDEVSLERRKIYLNMTKNGSSREIPMNKTCFEILSKLHSNRINEKVFQASRYKQPLKDPKKWFERSLAEAKITNFRWHDLRHTFISRLVMKGVDLRTVQELAGHKTIAMTVRYAHLAPEHNQAAIEKLDE